MELELQELKLQGSPACGHSIGTSILLTVIRECVSRRPSCFESHNVQQTAMVDSKQ